MKLNDSQTEYATNILHGTLKDISSELGFKPDYEDIIKCLEYALRSF